MLQLLGSESTIKPKYANSIEILANPIEFRLIFGVLSMGDILADNNTEMIITPTIAKAIAVQLTQAIENWEKDHGVIYMPDDVSGLEALFGTKVHDSPKEPTDE